MPRVAISGRSGRARRSAANSSTVQGGEKRHSATLMTSRKRTPQHRAYELALVGYRREPRFTFTAFSMPVSERRPVRGRSPAIRCATLSKSPPLASPTMASRWIRRSCGNYWRASRAFRNFRLLPSRRLPVQGAARFWRCAGKIDAEAKTLRIERSVDDTDKHGLRIKGPKTERGKRTITIDDAGDNPQVSFALAIKSVPDGVSVDLSLVKLPAGALIFPSPA
jgi:hypothetical protein